ncbi:MBL fold metallo-hydrolase [Gracilimonas mengyeensis]|nr:MBL fold metallo-hydrolase [Gracilimonas mengyeensis]
MQYGGNTTCVQVEIPSQDELLIFDCGTGLRNLGNALENDTDAAKGRIFITHPHWDHLQGFPFFKPFYDHKNWFRIYLPPQGEMGCREILQGHMSKTFFPVSMDMLQADIDCENFENGKKVFEHYTMEYMWANHTVPTAIFKLRTQDKSIVFAPDNEIPDEKGGRSADEFNSKLCDFLEGVDLLVHDAQYSKKQYQSKKGWGHSAWELTVDMAARAGVKQLCLTHHDPDNSDGVLARLEHTLMKEHADKFEKIWLAKEGQEITLPCIKSDKVSVQ